MTVHEFLHMGGYAVYVWPSYGLAAFILIWNLLVPIRRRRRLLSELARLERARSGQ